MSRLSISPLPHIVKRSHFRLIIFLKVFKISAAVNFRLGKVVETTI
jgi:hypothetical protein